MSRISKITVGRKAKISLGNYENTDVSVEFEGIVGELDDVGTVFRDTLEKANSALAVAVDEIELGSLMAKSKSGRFTGKR